MRLEEEINQERFANVHHKTLVNLIYTYGFLVNRMGGFFKGKGITRQQYNVLRILRGQYPKAANLSLIKQRMLDKMSDASRIVERLRVKKTGDQETKSQRQAGSGNCHQPAGIGSFWKKWMMKSRMFINFSKNYPLRSLPA